MEDPKESGRWDKNTAGFCRKILKWLTFSLNVLFVAIGGAILAGALFPGHSYLSGNKRLILGGILSVYGLARLTTLYIRDKRE